LRGLRDTARAQLRLWRGARSLPEDSPARLTIPYGVALGLGGLWLWFMSYAL